MRPIHGRFPAVMWWTAVLFTSVVSIGRTPTALAQTSPPLVFFDQASGTGPVVRTPNGPIEIITVPITDSLTLQNIGTEPAGDPLPAQSRLDFRWHAEKAGSSRVVGFQYMLFGYNSTFVSVDSSVHGVSYNPGTGVPGGINVFLLRVLDDQGGSREINRRFRFGIEPDTWIAGPDTTVLDSRFGWTGHVRSLAIVDWNVLPDLTGSLMSCDSLTLRPAERPEHKTFFEIYRNRLYVRSEYDTVHMNSWLIFHNGGFDPDSPYDVRVSSIDPDLPDTSICGPNGEADVIRPAGLTGSPIGFRFKNITRLDPNGPLENNSFSNVYPAFDPNSSFRMPVIGAYNYVRRSGKSYAWARAVDGGGLEDGSVVNGAAIVEHVDSGIGTPHEIAVRHKILTFYVNQAPHLLVGAGGFVPNPGHVFDSRTLSLNLLADDVDPFDPSVPSPPPGGPTPTKVLRWNIRVDGMDVDGNPVSHSPLAAPVFTPAIQFTVPGLIEGPAVTLDVELCDCAACETQPGQGRCVHYRIPVQIPDATTATLASLIGAESRPGLVRVRWRLESGARARVERRTPVSDWSSIGEARSDAGGELLFEDRRVESGGRYAYRLVLGREGSEVPAGEVWVEVTARLELALEGVRPHPARGGDLTVHFTLPGEEPARLSIVDAAGRRVAQHDLGSLAAGRHAVALGRDLRLRPGLYLIVLTQGSESRVARAAVLE